MNANTGPQSAAMVRPGTGGGMISSANNTMNFKQGPASSKGFQGGAQSQLNYQGHPNQISSKGFQ